MGVFQNNLLAGAGGQAAGAGGFYSYQIEQSCRFDGVASNSYINKTNGTSTNQKIGTFSFWVKRSILSTQQQLFFTYDGGGINSQFETTDKVTFSVNNATGGAENQESDGVFRDTGGWYHFVLAVDTTQSSNADRTKVYVNGVEDTSSGFDGTVTQDSILFNDTIKNNILLGKPDATEDEIIEALKIANAWEFVSQLPNGIETNVGDAGNNFSGGQKQRLSIARAVLKNPPIMILDEATSALDTESEKLVQEALENMMKNRTSIVIAHRLSTIQNADQIIVMQKGEIVEQGTHQELLAKNGMYKKLVEMQSFD